MKRDNLPKDAEPRVAKIQFRVKREEGKPMVIAGYAAVFNSLSELIWDFREKIAPGAFAEALKKSDVRALLNHDPNYIFGRTGVNLDLKEDDTGLFMEVSEVDDQTFRDVAKKIESGLITQQSFAFSVEEDSWVKGDWTKKIPEIRTIVKVREVFDVSPVTYPAYPDTTVALRSLQAFNAANRGGNSDANIRLIKNLQIISQSYEV